MKIFLRLLFILLFFLNFVVSEINDLHYSNTYHIAYSTMHKYKDFEYKFNGQFQIGRFGQLGIIAGEGGSLQSIDCIQFEEFKNLDSKGGASNWLFDGFKKAHQSLLEKMKDFKRKMPAELVNSWKEVKLKNLEKKLEKEEGMDLEELIKGMHQKWEGNIFFYKIFDYIKEEMPIHYMAIECKQFMAKLMSEEGEGNWLDLFTFMPKKGYEMLEKCNEYSKLQSTQLDLLIDLTLYRRHFEIRKNAKENGKKFKKTVIVGAGPIGLYTAFQFFMVGMRILVVNDRPENYIRKQITFLDPKWMVQLRFLLGTKFDLLFGRERAKGRVNPGETGKVNILDLETLLKERIFELMEMVDRIRIGLKGEKPLELWFETAFEEIRANESTGYLAHLGESKKAKNRNELVKKELSREANGEIIGEKAKEAVANEILEETLKGVEEEEKGKFERGNEEMTIGKKGNIIGPEGVDIPMDFLVCAGGANDRIRDKYLGAPKLMTKERNFGVGMVDKENLNEFIFEDFAILVDVDEMGKIGEYLERQNFDQLIQKEELIPLDIKEKYKNFDKMLRQKDPKGKQVIRIWENRPTIHIAASTPPALEQILEDLQRIRDKELKKFVHTFVGKFFLNCRFYMSKVYGWLRKKMEIKNDGNGEEEEEENIMEKIDTETNKKIEETTKRFKELRQKLERKWFLAVFDFALAQKHPDKIRIDKKDELKSHKEKSKILFNVDDKFTGHKNSLNFYGHLKLFFADFNVFTFPLRIQGPNASVKEFADLEIEGIKNGKNFEQANQRVAPGLIISLGDSNASPHFLSASGLSSGRVGVEKSAYAIRDYSLTESRKFDDNLLILEEKLSEKLAAVKRQVQRKAEGFDKLVSRNDGA